MQTTTTYRIVRGPRGSVLITAMWIAIALTAVVLVLCREMMVESLTTHQHLSQAQVDAAEIGVEQYVLSVLEQTISTPGYQDQVSWEQREIGDLSDARSTCYFWVLGVNVNDEYTPYYGLVDEASKIDLNTATTDMLDYLPGGDSDYSISQAIVDWRDIDEDESYSSTTGGQGAESTYYEGMDPPYRSKDFPLESVEELRLVYGMTEEILWGADKNQNNVIDDNETGNSSLGGSSSYTMRGLAAYTTVYGLRATNLQTITLQNLVNSGLPRTMIDPATGEEVPVVDINDVNTLTDTSTTGTSLQTLLQEYSPTRASTILTATQTRISGQQAQGQGQGQGQTATATTAQPFKSVAEWMVVMAQEAQATSADLYPIYPYLVCNNPTLMTAIQNAASGTTTEAAAATTAGTTSTTTSTLTIQGVTTIETLTEDTETGDFIASYAPAGMININTAPKAVLMALPMFEDFDADTIIAYRESNLIGQEPTDLPNIAWLLDCEIDPEKLAAAAPYITGSSTVYSADIVTVSRDGRAFKRVKIVVDTSTGTPQMIYRRDLTELGWPLDPQIRQNLRDGLEPGDAGGSGSSSVYGMR